MICSQKNKRYIFKNEMWMLKQTEKKTALLSFLDKFAVFLYVKKYYLIFICLFLHSFFLYAFIQGGFKGGDKLL